MEDAPRSVFLAQGSWSAGWMDGGRVISHLDLSASPGSIATSSCSLNTVTSFYLMSGLSDMQISYGLRQQETEKGVYVPPTHFTTEKAEVHRVQVLNPQSHSE